MSDVVTAAEAARAALDADAGDRALAVVTLVAGPANIGRRRLAYADGERRGSLGDSALDATADVLALEALAAHRPLDASEVVIGGVAWRLHAEAFRPTAELVVVGAGHVGHALAWIGDRLGFRVTVLDDREDFADASRFPDRARVLRMDPADPFRDVRIDGRTFIVLVTRAHAHDFDALRALLAADATPAYVGLIGSRRRIRSTFAALRDAGVPRERIAAVRAPVGLDVGAETPEEIAVSVAAELVLVRRRGADAADAAPLTHTERILERLLPEKG